MNWNIAQLLLSFNQNTPHQEPACATFKTYEMDPCCPYETLKNQAQKILNKTKKSGNLL